MERLVLTFLNESLEEEQLEDGETRTVLKIHPALAPYKVAVLPLIKKLHKDQAFDVYKKLSKTFDVTYDDTQNIGKRYRRQDAIGTYFCITIDHETEQDHSVTIRHRDTMQQERINIHDIESYVLKHIQF